MLRLGRLIYMYENFKTVIKYAIHITSQIIVKKAL
jgi:hypothetical protein